MSSHTRPKLSAGDISSLLAALPAVAATILSFFLSNSWRQWRQGTLCARSLRRNAAASFGTAIGLLKPRQLRAFVATTTGKTVADYCAANGLDHQPILVENPDGFPPAMLHFIDCKLAQEGPILLYFHGGGYIVPLHSPAFAVSSARIARASPVLLEYTLVPECEYPGQLSQAVAALRLILQHRSPADIIIAGESAGGNMALAILAHLQQPKPNITPLALPGAAPHNRFKGAVAISPRTANLATAESFRTNSGKDFMSEQSLLAITANWKPEADVWAAPVLAPRGFWDGLRAEKLLLVVGADEVYRDDVCHTAKMMGAREVGVGSLDAKTKLPRGASALDAQLIICPNEMHCQASLDMSLGIRDGHMTRGVAGWLAGC